MRQICKTNYDSRWYIRTFERNKWKVHIYGYHAPECYRFSQLVSCCYINCVVMFDNCLYGRYDGPHVLFKQWEQPGDIQSYIKGELYKSYAKDVVAVAIRKARDKQRSLILNLLRGAV